MSECAFTIRVEIGSPEEEATLFEFVQQTAQYIASHHVVLGGNFVGRKDTYRIEPPVPAPLVPEEPQAQA